MAVDYTGQGVTGQNNGQASPEKVPFVNQGTVVISGINAEKIVQVYEDMGNGSFEEIDAYIVQDAGTITVTMTPLTSGYILYY